MQDYKTYILSQLKYRQYARFSDIKPPKVSTNAFSYHLKKMIKDGWLLKTDDGYTLAIRGLAYADRESANKLVRSQPNIGIVLLIQDGYGKVLLKKRQEQPYIGSWGLPFVNAGVADTSVEQAGTWACKQLLKTIPDSVKHVGDCYVRTHKGKLAIGSVLNHVVRVDAHGIDATDEFAWFEPLSLSQMILVPGTESVITRAFFNDNFFFEEYTVQLKDQVALALG